MRETLNGRGKKEEEEEEEEKKTPFVVPVNLYL